MERRVRPYLAVVVGLAVWIAAASGCEDHSAGSKCYDAEGPASADSVAILNTVHVGDDLQVRITGLIGFCMSLRRVERESRGDTVLFRPINGGTVCPHSPCVPSMKRYADTLAIAMVHAGRMWVRVVDRHERIVDSTVVLPSSVGSP